ncbi:FecR family protein [Azomonas macrocytogenes]|uniref:Transmembrane sensor n=1 Tax=Azomonas macrocytogenes TaxID=69962 RepID=A0A839T3R9_AZOMA|nr:FecR domain-containing protein [Azomonas macrocytogenes]MBB3103649.1 transmembrane sensor [Azomonas macrocytogenes]
MTPEDRAIGEQAAEWLIHLNEEDLDAAERQRFAAWKNQDPRHAAAIERLQGFVGQMQTLRPQKTSAHAALDAAFGQRKRSRGKRGLQTLLLLLVLALPAAALLLHDSPFGYLLADLRTAPGEWRSQVLADHTRLDLAGNSAVDLRFDTRQRRIELLKGEILVEVAPDTRRPFVVETEHGRMRALGTRFLVRREDGATRLIMLESRVAAHGSASPAEVEVVAGEQALITPSTVRLDASIDPHGIDAAWNRHQLVVQDRPLPEVLDELARQHSGFLYFNRQALEHLRVSAVLPLDDPQRALNLIAETLPIQVRIFSPWLVLIGQDEESPDAQAAPRRQGGFR